MWRSDLVCGYDRDMVSGRWVISIELNFNLIFRS